MIEQMWQNVKNSENLDERYRCCKFYIILKLF